MKFLILEEDYNSFYRYDEYDTDTFGSTVSHIYSVNFSNQKELKIYLTTKRINKFCETNKMEKNFFDYSFKFSTVDGSNPTFYMPIGDEFRFNRNDMRLIKFSDIINQNKEYFINLFIND